MTNEGKKLPTKFYGTTKNGESVLLWEDKMHLVVPSSNMNAMGEWQCVVDGKFDVELSISEHELYKAEEFNTKYDD